VSPAILEASAAVSAAVGNHSRNLPGLTEKLASLRYLIILTARWAASDSIGEERRKVMHRDLARLRREYSFFIDDIAMSIGIQQAMDAKERVEASVVVPKGIKPPEGHNYEEGFSIDPF
jgi:hypothetical protein